MIYRNHLVRLFFIPVVGMFVFTAYPAVAATRSIIFPVLGTTSYSNDFGNKRVGHNHEGNDIFGKKMQPLLAAVDGIAQQVAYPEPSYGWYIRIEGVDGYTYSYIHINNDTPGTDDGRGGGNNAYAPGVDRRWPVVAGQVIAYMGDSGNAENTHAHLHFEIRTPNGQPINPFSSLKSAQKLTRATVPPALPFEILSYSQFHVGANIATGDVAPEYSGDEVVAGAGLGSPPQIRILTPSGGEIGGFFLQQRKIRGGVDVAVGDVNGDGMKDIITGLGPGNDALVQIHNRRGDVLAQFLAYNKKFRGGVRVSTADLDGDGVDEIITGAGRGGGPEVRVYRMNGELLACFNAYLPNFHGGIDVAGISATATQAGRIVTAPAAGGGPDIRVYAMNGSFITGFWSGDSTFSGGMRVTTSINSITGEASIYTVPMSRGHGLIRQLTLTGVIVSEQNVFERWWIGGYDVAVGDGVIYTSSALKNRRGSIMKTTLSTNPFRFGFYW